jgi:glutamate N-acetyltransferase/amino-acid N-acetyltransferase
MLAKAVEASFNCISVDGDTSTNDTVLLLASGASGVEAQGFSVPAFEAGLQMVCESLALQIVRDGEGVTHVVTLNVTGARDRTEARQIARSIANSPLCKTAWSSADPNWGRILAAAGKAGVAFDPAQVKVRIAGLPVFAQGVRAAEYDEAATHEAMKQPEYTIEIALGQGSASAKFVTCDLTHEYVSINADYST